MKKWYVFETVNKVTFVGLWLFMSFVDIIRVPSVESHEQGSWGHVTFRGFTLF